MNKHILYVSSIVPRQGTGGWIVIYRHLKRLENSGWRISLVLPEQTVQAEQFPVSWEVIVMPMRKWWWLPMRSYLPASLELRLLFWQLECETALKGRRPDSILTIIGDHYALLASRLTKTWKIPLSVIIHDDLKLRETTKQGRIKFEKYAKLVLDRSARAWLVSPEMKDAFSFNESTRISVLLPLPEGSNQNFVEWKQSFKTNPVIAHAGSFYLFHVPYFKKIAEILKRFNGTLLIVTSKDNPALLSLLEASTNVKVQEPFDRNQDVLCFLKDNASCMLICYPFGLEQHPWTATSFPSRMVEFMHLGLPFLILASPNTALANWGMRNNWRSYFDHLDESSLSNFFEELTREETWSLMAAQAQYAATHEFDPDQIQAQFENELELLS